MSFNIANLFETVVDAIPGEVALVDENRSLTFSQLDERANRLANHLASLGVGPGDHIGLYVYNGTEYMESMLAAVKLRAVSINLNYRYVAEELKYVVNDADVKVLIFTRELADVVKDSLDDFDDVEHIIYIDDDSGADVNFGDAAGYEDVLAAAAPERPEIERSGDDVFIVYTGGTTGMPKGVMWRHEDLFFAGLQGGRPQDDPIDRPEELGPIAESGDFKMNIFCGPPFIHGSSQFASLITLFTGGRVVMTNGRSYRPGRALEMMEEQGVNVLVLVGDAMSRPLLDEVRENGDKYDLNNLMVVTSQGAPLSRTIQKEFGELLPYTMVMNNYGASETGHQGRAVPSEMNEEGKDSRIQFIMNEHTMVVDDDFQPVAPGEVGKVARKGRIPLGYYKDEKKTRETFIERDGERYVLLGDFATVDDMGLVTLLGRHSICINTGGEKVYPEEVEEALQGHPAVNDVLVVGVADDRWGQRVEAVVELREGETAEPESLDAHCRGKVAGYKIPRNWHFTDKVQRQPSGKPDYKWARAYADEQNAG